MKGVSSTAPGACQLMEGLVKGKADPIEFTPHYKTGSGRKF